MQRNLETDEQVPAEPSHWLNVLQGLRLSKQQVLDVAGAHDHHTSRVARLMVERTKIQAMLGQVCWCKQASKQASKAQQSPYSVGHVAAL